MTPDKAGTLVVWGYNVQVKVRDAHLELTWGLGNEEHVARVHRVKGGLKRLVIFGTDGYMTFAADDWFRDAKASWCRLDRDGHLKSQSAEPLRELDVKLRRAQVLASLTETGLDITRALLGLKLRGQAKNLQGYDFPAAHGAAEAILGCAEGLGRHVSQDTLRNAEARAAEYYWRILQTTPITFAKGAKVPDHWRHLGQRHSLLTNSARQAITPGHALLNYCYALLEHEATRQLQVAGLDPQLGYNHYEKAYRDSLASDVMEAVRPEVDRFVLDFLSRATFGPHDFGETSEGQCRLHHDLAIRLASETLPMWAKHVAPAVRLIVNVLRASQDTAPSLVATPHAENDARTFKVRRELRGHKTHRDKLAEPVIVPAAPAVTRRCALCTLTSGSKPLEVNGRVFCSQVCADSWSLLAQYAELLRDSSLWTAETWAALWPAIRRAPQPRIRAILGCSTAWSSFVVNGKYRPKPQDWSKLCEGLLAA